MKLSQKYKKLASLILVIFFGFSLVIAGLDKFFNILDNWVVYLNPKLLPFPIAPVLFMRFVGVFEVLLGLSLLIFARRRKTISYVVAAWFILISINLLSLNLYFVAFKDSLRAIGAILLAKLSE